MLNKTLHITNGDGTTNYLKKLQVKGKIITWREMLCEGKTLTDVGSEKFWNTRFQFFKNSYNISKEMFINLTLKEYRSLCNTKNSKEIVLWFEHDLFCQINMLAVLSWLKKHRKGYTIFLVCSGKIKGSDKMFSLTDLSENQILEHYKNKIELDQNDIEYAHYIWQLYCSNSPLRLETVNNFKPNKAFKYLVDALKVHLKRFPSIENGLNNTENFILETANNFTFSTKKQFITKLLELQQVFGFGDIQYETAINNLNNAFDSINPTKLSKKGKELLVNETNYYRELRSDNSYLGGSKKYSFLYSNASEKLLQITN